jgi:phosphate transport system substrate-binding protein
MKVTVVVLIVLIGLLLAGGVALPVQDKVLIYGGAAQGKVIFDHKMHASKGKVCNDCHSAIFETAKKALISMDDHSSDKKCFVCHNGTKVFNECGQCHRKF